MRKILKLLTGFSVASTAVIPTITITSCTSYSRKLTIKGETAFDVYAGKGLKKDYIVPGEESVTFSITSLEKEGTPCWAYFTDNKLNVMKAPSNNKGERKFRITAVSNTDPSAIGTLDITINILIDKNDIAAIVTQLAKPKEENRWKQDNIPQDLEELNPDVDKTFWDNVEPFGIKANSFFIIPKTTTYSGALYIDDTQVYNIILKTTDDKSYYIYDINDLCSISNVNYILINSVQVPRTSIISVDIDSDTLVGIPNNFLYMCPRLTYVDFSNCNNLVSIGDQFLYQCGSSLSQIDFPATLTTIGSQFCFCSDSNVVWDFTETSLKSIGSSFLQHNAYLNKELILPSTVETIGSNFLTACYKFNQNLTLPASLKSVGDWFMYCVNDYTSTIDFGDLTGDIFAGLEDTKQILSTSDNKSACYVNGITIDGTNIESIIKVLPNLEEISAYRKLIRPI